MSQINLTEMPLANILSELTTNVSEHTIHKNYEVINVLQAIYSVELTRRLLEIGFDEYGELKSETGFFHKGMTKDDIEEWFFNVLELDFNSLITLAGKKEFFVYDDEDIKFPVIDLLGHLVFEVEIEDDDVITTDLPRGMVPLSPFNDGPYPYGVKGSTVCGKVFIATGSMPSDEWDFEIIPDESFPYDETVCCENFYSHCDESWSCSDCDSEHDDECSICFADITPYKSVYVADHGNITVYHEARG